MPPGKKKLRPEGAPDKKSDLEILDALLETLYNSFSVNPKGVKVTDILKVIELKAKLKPDSSQSEFEKQFWKLLNKIRTQELAEKKSPENSLSGSVFSAVSDTAGPNQYQKKKGDAA